MSPNFYNFFINPDSYHIETVNRQTRVSRSVTWCCREEEERRISIKQGEQ